MRKLQLLLSVLFAGLLVVACGAGESGLVPRSVATLSITPDGVTDGEVDTAYDFTFTAVSIPKSVSTVTFEWILGDGKTTGNRQVQVVNGSASVTVTHTYTAKNVYGLAALVKQSGGSVLAAKAIAVAIGANPEREMELASCDGWRASKEGGYGVAIDNWDISAVPVGAVFDLRFDTIKIPDKIVVDYPDGVEVFDSGWRGAPAYDDSPLYPGGLDGGGKGGDEGIFSKTDADTFKVTVFGPDPATKWSYEVRCSIP